LKGPAAKNYQSYQTTASSLVTTDQEPLQGPAAKNAQIRKSDQSYALNAVETNADRPRLIGPQAKNAKPWQKYRSSEVRVKAPANSDNANLSTDIKTSEE
jgi:hypothetical protein